MHIEKKSIRFSHECIHRCDGNGSMKCAVLQTHQSGSICPDFRFCSVFDYLQNYIFFSLRRCQKMRSKCGFIIFSSIWPGLIILEAKQDQGTQ